MIPPVENKLDGKKMTVIDDLVEQGVFKVEGRQLYELSLYELIKEHMEKLSNKVSESREQSCNSGSFCIRVSECFS
ncbi:Fur-regulated basic protein FbpA [Leptospira santarosai]|nr:Fur-regulated basic protein FbpA [Leptospira santarosai]